MKNRTLVCLTVTGLFIAACGGQPAAPATEIIPTAVVVASTPVPNAAAPTTTLIPLPQSQSQPPVQNTAIVPGITIPLAGLTGPSAAPNGVALNCRAGPDIAWPVTTVLNPGQSVEVMGKNADGTWWYVRNPSLAGSLCWISASLATVTGNVNAVQVVSAPPPPVIYPTAGTAITSITIAVEPNTILLPGCIGPIQTVGVWAKIQTNGPVEIVVNFRDDLLGDLPSHRRKFDRADIKDVSDTFTPMIVAGKHNIRIVIEGFDLGGLHPVATYRIKC